MLFSELYGVYYNTVAEILKSAVKGELTEKKLKSIVADKAFGESILTIPSSLTNGSWQLITPDFKTPLTSVPSLPLTTVEKMWLKAISLDPRICLFDINFEGLSDITPLFTPDMICYFDRYSDGDDYTNPDYIARFKTIVRAVKDKKLLKIELNNRYGECVQVNIMPEHLEYSEKDDKFRLIASGNKYCQTINLGRIINCKIYSGKNIDSKIQHREQMSVVTFVLSDGRNSVERAMLHFAHFEKQIEQLSEDTYTVQVKYNSNDQTELLIRILSFGPFIKVTEPESFVELIRNRLLKQQKCGLV